MTSPQTHQNPQNFLEMVGNTPLIRLNAVSDATGCEIYGKAEFANPGGSVKDRAAKGIIEAAEASGELTKGGIIVEGTAGNTGISLTLAGNSRGYCYARDAKPREKRRFAPLRSGFAVGASCTLS